MPRAGFSCDRMVRDAHLVHRPCRRGSHHAKSIARHRTSKSNRPDLADRPVLSIPRQINHTPGVNRLIDSINTCFIARSHPMPINAGLFTTSAAAPRRCEARKIARHPFTNPPTGRFIARMNFSMSLNNQLASPLENFPIAPAPRISFAGSGSRRRPHPPGSSPALARRGERRRGKRPTSYPDSQERTRCPVSTDVPS